jgi:hypothetical protein
LSGEFSPGFSLTAPITRKSQFFFTGRLPANQLLRVLLATIKNLGGCPCPRCFIEKAQIPEMGTKADMRRRQKIRQDTSGWRNKIERVRSWIFEKGYLIAGAAVNRVLKPQSWVPTRVSVCLF